MDELKQPPLRNLFYELKAKGFSAIQEMILIHQTLLEIVQGFSHFALSVIAKSV